jgi:hypothetical protein
MSYIKITWSNATNGILYCLLTSDLLEKLTYDSGVIPIATFLLQERRLTSTIRDMTYVAMNQAYILNHAVHIDT